MKNSLQISFAFAAFLLPVAVFAATGQGTLDETVRSIGSLVALAIPIAAALALLAFFWGLALYLFNFGEGKEDAQKKGRNLMIYGILAIFVIVSVFGIARLLQKSFGIQENPQNVTPPTINIGGQGNTPIFNQ